MEFHLFILHSFIKKKHMEEFLLCARQCSRLWDTLANKTDRGPCSQADSVEGGRQTIGKIYIMPEEGAGE